jgi:hypothetical protein
VKIIVSTNRNMIMGNHLARRMIKIKHVADIKHQNVKTQKHINVCTSVDMLSRKHPVINSIVDNLPIDY